MDPDITNCVILCIHVDKKNSQPCHLAENQCKYKVYGSKNIFIIIKTLLIAPSILASSNFKKKTIDNFNLLCSNHFPLKQCSTNSSTTKLNTWISTEEWSLLRLNNILLKLPVECFILSQFCLQHSGSFVIKRSWVQIPKVCWAVFCFTFFLYLCFSRMCNTSRFFYERYSPAQFGTNLAQSARNKHKSD